MTKRTHFSSFAQVVAAIALIASLAIQRNAPGQAPGQAPGPTPGPIQTRRPQPTVPSDATFYSVNVKSFGAVTDDRRDDTAAIQAAIDSIPVPNTDNGLGGGVVFFPRGTYNLTSVRLPPAVQLAGEGEGTYLVGRGDAPTIALWSPFGHGFVVGSAVRDMKIFSPTSECISFDRKTVIGNICNARFENLNLRSGKGHFAILLDIYSQDCVLRNIKVLNYGGGAVHIFGNANLLDRINTEGSDHDKAFACEPGRLTVRGAGNTISGCIIEGGSEPAVAIHVEGSFTWINNWMEVSKPKDGIAYRFVNCWGQIDDLKLLGDHYKVKMENCNLMQIARLDMRSGTFANTFILDDKTNVVVDLVATQMDCAWLDHERVKIRSYWNEHANVILDNPPSTRGIKLIKVPSAAPVAPGVSVQETPDTANWIVQDPMNQPGDKAEFDIVHETTDAGESVLRIDVRSNPSKHNLSVKVPLAVAGDLVGKRAVLQVTLDPSIKVWSKDFKANYPIRIHGERTMCATPPLEAQDEVNFVIEAPEAGRSVRMRGLSVIK